MSKRQNQNASRHPGQSSNPMVFGLPRAIKKPRNDRQERLAVTILVHAGQNEEGKQSIKLPWKIIFVIIKL